MFLFFMPVDEPRDPECVVALVAVGVEAGDFFGGEEGGEGDWEGERGGRR